MKPLRIYVAALVVLVLVLATFGCLFHTSLRHQSSFTAGQANETFTRHFVNEHWNHLRALLLLGGAAEQIRANPAFDQIDAVVRHALHGTDLVMLKIYDARGSLVYAPDPTLLGQSRSDSAGFLQAVKGRAYTRMYRNEVTGFDGNVRDLELVSSYVPVKGDVGTQAVVEVYRDQSEPAQALSQTWWQAMLAVGAGLAALTAALVWLFQVQLRRSGDLETANQTLLREQQQAREDVRRAELDKQWFLSGVGCELQSPLEGMKKSLHQLSRLVPAGAAVKHLQEGLAHAATLDQRLSDFMTVVELESGALQPLLQPFHLGGLIRQLGALLRQRTELKRLECVVYIAPAVDKPYLGDPGKIERVLSVLLDNAVRFTDAGSVQLRAHASAGKVMLDVVDTGAGLADEQLHALLKSMGRQATFQSSTARGALDVRVSHISVGLVMAEGLTELMGGQMIANSTPGRGSWFTVCLPLEPVVDQPTEDGLKQGSQDAQ